MDKKIEARIRRRLIENFGDSPKVRLVLSKVLQEVDDMLSRKMDIESNQVAEENAEMHGMIPVDPGEEINWITGKLQSRTSDVKKVGGIHDEEDHIERSDGNGQGDGTDGDDGTERGNTRLG